MLNTNTVASRYDKLFSQISKIAKRRLEMVDMIQQMFNSFTASFVGLIDEFDQFFYETDGNVKRSMRGSEMARFTEWASHFISNYQVNRAFYQDLLNLKDKKTKDFGEKYYSEIEKLQELFRAEREKLDVEAQRYLTQYEVYINMCNKIEEIGDMLTKKEMSSSKQETYQRELDKLRAECIIVEEKTAMENDNYRKAILSFQTAVDKLLIKFEKFEKKFFVDVQDIIYQFVSISNKLSDSYKVLGEAAESDLKSLEKLVSDLKNADNTPRKVSAIVEEFSQVPQLCFDVFEYIPWNIIFHGELHSTFMKVTTNFKAEDGYLSLEANEIVKVIKETNSYVIIESDKTGIRGKVPPSIVKPAKDYKRKVYQLNDDFMDSETVISKGHFVICLSSDNTIAKCKTAGGVFVNIPLSMLTLAQKNK